MTLIFSGQAELAQKSNEMDGGENLGFARFSTVLSLVGTSNTAGDFPPTDRELTDSS